LREKTVTDRMYVKDFFLVREKEENVEHSRLDNNNNTLLLMMKKVNKILTAFFLVIIDLLLTWKNVHAL
jgi:hypothetical protein